MRISDIQDKAKNVITAFLAANLLSFRSIAAAEVNASSANPVIEQIKSIFHLLFIVIIILAAVVLFFIVRIIYRNTIGKKLQTTLIEDYRKAAEALKKEGRYVSAAVIFENRLKDIESAASLYEKGNDFRKAAEMYNLLGMNEKSREMYLKDNNPNAAAQSFIIDGDFENAAKIYDQAGEKLDAGIALEKAGKRLAASRAYREAGEYKRASELLEEEGMTKEAVEMFGLYLIGKEIDSTNINDFYTYASKLEKSGKIENAANVLALIDRFNPAYLDVRERLHTLTSFQGDNISLEGKTTLRGMIKGSKIEPKHCLKLWLQILKTLQNAYKSGRELGLISPENIIIDSSNNMSLLQSIPSSAYTSPEKLKGIKLQPSADVYSLGIILYEMLTGSLDGLGCQRVTDINPELPDWLDEMIIKCIKKVKEDRYQRIEEILEDIKLLSRSKKQEL
jgi:tetratricopeptide (TPR) repeat protein